MDQAIAGSETSVRPNRRRWSNARLATRSGGPTTSEGQLRTGHENEMTEASIEHVKEKGGHGEPAHEKVSVRGRADRINRLINVVEEEEEEEGEGEGGDGEEGEEEEGAGEEETKKKRIKKRRKEATFL